MAILIDEPRWPNHGTVWAHLVSDASLSELHGFASTLGIPTRGFDHDHYDVPAHLHAAALGLGALPVSSGELVRRLIASGLRVPARHRAPSRAAAVEDAVRRWDHLMPGHPHLGASLTGRWREPHRHYHDVRHLTQCLAALDELTGGTPTRPVALAAWYHDAVYLGRPGQDEEAAAALAEAELAPVVGEPEAREVARLVRLTTTHAPDPGDQSGALLSDADLSILAVNQGRYHVYLRDVRLEYSHVPDAEFLEGRRQVVESLLGGGTLAEAPSPGRHLFHSPQGRDLWEADARENLQAELRSLTSDPENGWLARVTLP